LALQTPKFYLAGSKKSRKSGFLRSIDRKNPHLKQALTAASAAACETIDRPSLIRESLLMGFRLRRGVDEARFESRFSRPLAACIPKTISRWRRRGFFEGGSLAPSAAGLLFADAFLRDAFGELDC
jgi:coproporphyrinogen III oxidase-like Fe-S oxidoreductase